LIPRIAFFLTRPRKLEFGDRQAGNAHDPLLIRPRESHFAGTATGLKRSQMKF
jgi:hypothetical protein